MAKDRELGRKQSCRGRNLRIVNWTDKNGYMHAAWLRDKDLDIEATRGLQVDPAIETLIDWESVVTELGNSLIEKGILDWSEWKHDMLDIERAKRDLHNQIVCRKLFQWDDIQASDNSLIGAISGSVRNQLERICGGPNHEITRIIIHVLKNRVINLYRRN